MCGSRDRPELETHFVDEPVDILERIETRREFGKDDVVDRQSIGYGQTIQLVK